MRQDLRAAVILIVIDDLDDKLVGTFANFVDGIKWLVGLCTLEEKNSH